MTTQTKPDMTVARTAAKEMTYQPYGAADNVRLSIDIVKNLIAVPTRSGKTCSDNDAIKFMMMCQSRRLDPFSGDAFLIGYDGQNGPEFSLITAHQAFLKRAELHPEYDGMKSGIIIAQDNGQVEEREGDFHFENEAVAGGWATVFCKNRKYPTTRRVRMARFNKGFAQWKADAAGMICKCAEADALRSTFPTMLGGLYMREEVDAAAFGIMVQPVERQKKPNLELPPAATTGPEPAQQQEQPPPEPAQEQPTPRRRSPKPAATQEQAVAEGVAAKTHEAPAAPAIPTTNEMVSKEIVIKFIADSGVTFDDFRDFLVSDGHVKDVDSFAEFSDVPAAVYGALHKNAAALAKLVKMFGKKG